jgi:hypothetical protein
MDYIITGMTAHLRVVYRGARHDLFRRQEADASK